MSYKYQKQYRYKKYDYSQNGFYFVTICTKNRQLFFENIINEKIELSVIGKIANKYWLEIVNHFSLVKLHEYVIMPNHIHGIIEIDNPTSVGTGQCPVPTTHKYSKFSHVIPKSLSTIIGSFKSIVTTELLEMTRN